MQGWKYKGKYKSICRKGCKKSIIKLGFKRNSIQISAGLTKKNNITLVGNIEYSDDITVSYLNNLVDISGKTAVDRLGIACFSNHEVANLVINQINNIQVDRHKKGSRFPFVWLTIM